MAYRRLGRTGFESKRNLAKSFRPPRIVKNSKGEDVFHELDMMRLGVDGRQVNTTGCFGEVSTWGLGYINVKFNNQGYPGRNKRPRRKKNVSKIYIRTVHIDFRDKTYNQLYNLRANLMTGILLAEGSGTFVGPGTKMIFEQITKYIAQAYPEQVAQMHSADEHRKNSVAGMIKAGAVYHQLKSHKQRIKRALANMRERGVYSHHKAANPTG